MVDASISFIFQIKVQTSKTMLNHVMGTCTILVLVLVLVLFSDRTWQRLFGDGSTVFSKKDFWFFLIVLPDAALKHSWVWLVRWGCHHGDPWSKWLEQCSQKSKCWPTIPNSSSWLESDEGRHCFLKNGSMIDGMAPAPKKWRKTVKSRQQPLSSLVINNLVQNGSHCLKIIEKVSFNIASEEIYVYILSGQMFILKMPKIVHFGELLKTWSWRPNSVTRQVSFNSGQFVKIPFRTYVRLLDSLEYAPRVPARTRKDRRRQWWRKL